MQAPQQDNGIGESDGFARLGDVEEVKGLRNVVTVQRVPDLDSSAELSEYLGPQKGRKGKGRG